MQTFSTARIASIALVLVGILAIVVLADPVKYYVHQWTEPVVVRPEVSGVVDFYGAPKSGVEVRVARIDGKSWPGCYSLAVQAVSDKAGAFVVPALRKPSFLINKSARTPWGVCLTYGKTQVDGWMWFPLPNETPSRKYKCDFPSPQTGQPEDHPCYTP